MKVALPSIGEHVDGHFGHCEFFTIFTIDDQNQIVHEERLVPSPGCGCKSGVAGELAAQGVTVMLAGGIGQGAVNTLAASGIQVVRGCEGGLREAVGAWLQGKVRDSGENCSQHGPEGCHNP